MPSPQEICSYCDALEAALRDYQQVLEEMIPSHDSQQYVARLVHLGRSNGTYTLNE